MSCWFACGVRAMSFAGLGALSIANVSVDYDAKWNTDDGGGSGINDDAAKEDVDTNQDFYNKSCVVLFDLPDYIIMSTHVLLILVGSECFISSRYHTLQVRERERDSLCESEGIDEERRGATRRGNNQAEESQRLGIILVASLLVRCCGGSYGVFENGLLD